ncbi:hypothetical protein FQA39_LY04888 [Lamprigera yunnana]|nr:hypothetical protein FQA39_LY04888 [Lamprigera yunnana]
MTTKFNYNVGSFETIKNRKWQRPYTTHKELQEIVDNLSDLKEDVADFENESEGEEEIIEEVLLTCTRSVKSSNSTKELVDRIVTVLDDITDKNDKLKLYVKKFLNVTINDAKADCKCAPFHLCYDDKINTDGRGFLEARTGINPCRVLGEICCETKNLNRNVSNVIKLEDCGYRSNITSNLSTDTDKTESKYGDYPWTMVILNKDFHYKCVGSLIHPQVVLTTAYCVQNDADKYVVRAGVWNITAKADYENRNVKIIIKHQQYSVQSLAFNVALLILDSPFKLEPNIRTICLADENRYQLEKLESECAATGWGRNAPKGLYRRVMKKINFSTISRSACQSKFHISPLGKWFELHRSFVCGVNEEGLDLCSGDGGGPLVCPLSHKPLRFHQVGITSWGLSCNGDFPSVFIDVSYVRNWIDSQFYTLNLTTQTNDLDTIYNLIDKNNDKVKHAKILLKSFLENNSKLLENQTDCICLKNYLCGELSANSTESISKVGSQANGCESNGCCNERIAKLKIEDVPETLKHVPKCGYRFNFTSPLLSNTTDDTVTNFGEYPWTALIYKNFLYTCTGSLIHPKVVITAANCVFDSKSTYSVRVGEWDRNSIREPYGYQNANVESMIIHPRYNEFSLIYNVALMIVKETFDLKPNVMTICLLSESEVDLSIYHTKCVATGWGKNIPTGSFRRKMKKIDYALINYKTCERRLRHSFLGMQFNLNRCFVCGRNMKYYDLCVGDTGGPLVCPISENPLRFHQVGITAWQIDCHANFATVFTKVTYVKNWIDKEFDKLNFYKGYYAL